MKFAMVSDSKRRLLQVFGAVFIITALVWGGIALSPVIGSGEFPATKGKLIYAKMPEEGIEARWTEVKRMREKMRPWAENHQNLIRRMKNGDDVAFRQVQDVIPVRAYASIIGFGVEDGLFTWNCYMEKSLRAPELLPDERTKNRHQSSVDRYNSLMDANWVKHKDIALTDSVMEGKYRYVLWASGRITKSYDVPGCLYLDCFTEREQEEVMPSFDFIANGKA